MTLKEKSRNLTIAKPFVKWAGGKGSLVNLLSAHLPADFCEKKCNVYRTFCWWWSNVVLYAYTFSKHSQSCY